MMHGRAGARVTEHGTAGAGPNRQGAFAPAKSGSDQKRPQPTPPLSFSPRQRLRDVAGVRNEKLRHRAEGPPLQRDYSDRSVSTWQLNGQLPDIRAPRRKSQGRNRKNREKAPGRQETHPHV